MTNILTKFRKNMDILINQIWNFIFGESYYFKPLKNIQLSDIKGGLKILIQRLILAISN